MTTSGVITLAGLALPETGPLRRHVRPAGRRTALYQERYDRRTLLYDAVRLPEGGALLTTPRLLNLWPMLRAGLQDDREGIAQAARALGLFDAATAPHHVAAMVEMTARVCAQFRATGPYAFAATTLPQNLRDAGLELALDQRFTHIPPMDTLFVQRKLAGIFLLATRLRARVDLHALLARHLPPAAGRALPGTGMTRWSD